jgi:hypothetical protein
MDIRQLTQRIIKRSSQFKAPIAVAIVAGAVGFASLQYSHAATFAANFEAESGNLSGNQAAGGTAGASGGASVKFGAAIVDPLPPPSTATCPTYPSTGCPDLGTSPVAAGSVGYTGSTSILSVVDSGHPYSGCSWSSSEGNLCPQNNLRLTTCGLRAV